MKSEIYNYVKESARNWWVSVLVGIVMIVLGIWSMLTPAAALVSITYAFVIAMFIGGFLDIVFAASNSRNMTGWGWTLAGGIIDILFGVFLLFMPKPVITLIFLYFIGFWILFHSIWTIGAALEINRYINAGWMIAIGVLSLVFAILYLFSPLWVSGATVVVLVSIALLFYGIFRIYYAIQLKSVNRRLHERAV